MQDNIDEFEPGELLPDYPELQALAYSLLEEGDIGELAAPNPDTADWTPRTSVALNLNELLGDGAGEVVLASDAQLNLTSSSQVKDAGLVEHHVTADGEDVSGFAYLSFESGITVYYPSGSDLTLDAIIA